MVEDELQAGCGGPSCSGVLSRVGGGDGMVFDGEFGISHDSTQWKKRYSVRRGVCLTMYRVGYRAGRGGLLHLPWGGEGSLDIYGFSIVARRLPASAR